MLPWVVFISLFWVFNSSRFYSFEKIAGNYLSDNRILTPSRSAERETEGSVHGSHYGLAERYQDDLPSYSTLEQEFNTSYTAWYGDKKEPELSELYFFNKGKCELSNQIHTEKA